MAMGGMIDIFSTNIQGTIIVRLLSLTI